MEGEGGEGKMWERAWSIDEMRKCANNWSLAGDAGVSICPNQHTDNILSANRLK